MTNVSFKDRTIYAIDLLLALMYAMLAGWIAFAGYVTSYNPLLAKLIALLLAVMSLIAFEDSRDRWIRMHGIEPLHIEMGFLQDRLDEPVGQETVDANGGDHDV